MVFDAGNAKKKWSEVKEMGWFSCSEASKFKKLNLGSSLP